MKWTDLAVVAGANRLGRTEDTAVAVAEGRYDADVRGADGFLSVSVADGRNAMDLAVDAARAALDRAPDRPREVALLIHATCGPQGPAHIAPASYIHGTAVGGPGSAVEVKQSSNGGMAALDLAAAYLAAAPPGTTALVTTGDTFGPPVDRYRCDTGNIMADGATALLLRRGPGVARLLSTVVIGDGRFSDIGVADSAAFPDRPAFFAEHGHRLLDLVKSMGEFQRESIRRALADAGLTGGAEIRRWVFDNVGRTMVDRDVRAELGVDDADTCWEWGRRTGHLGAGDQAGGLVHLLETGAVRPGDRVALCGMGSGFTYSCAVLEIAEQPTWTAAPGEPPRD